MRLNQIKSRDVQRAVDDYIASIHTDAICALASSFRDGEPCRIFMEMRKGSFNLCYFIVFNSEPESDKGDKWVVRIPIVPRLGFPEEKMRAEIATMKYVAQKTKIPIPRLFGYSVGSDNLIRVPYMLLEYIDGRQLTQDDVASGSGERRKHIFEQLADIYLELYDQRFDSIGALTLDVDGSSWSFGCNRPLSSTISEQELGGLDPSAVVPVNRTFASAIDYYYALTGLAFNDFIRARDSVLTEKDARDDLYDLHKFRSGIMDWVDPELNHGPYCLMHGDLLPSNIIVDEDCNIKAIIDWEWSRTVPPQLFVPPGWVSGDDIASACHGVKSMFLAAALSRFDRALRTRIQTSSRYSPELRRFPFLHPLASLWSKNLDCESFCIAYALLRPDKCIEIFWKILDHYYHGSESRESRVRAFYEADASSKQNKLVQKKMDEAAEYLKELRSLGIEPKPREECPPAATMEQLRIQTSHENGLPQRTNARFLQRLVGFLTPSASTYRFPDYHYHLALLSGSSLIAASIIILRWIRK
ncbi:kinase-like domain-containing protein [Lineolata rhizophorae]|uniref:Kinase-like domain-containing protein n=1 Tax=Lineolata rhizophorae TaxID=578093 RepID=A0A6A6NL20_9PEZI|nr:kinase-like domain-containing protein [Lineolata rhizophorae]